MKQSKLNPKVNYTSLLDNKALKNDLLMKHPYEG